MFLRKKTKKKLVETGKKKLVAYFDLYEFLLHFQKRESHENLVFCSWIFSLMCQSLNMPGKTAA